MHDDPRSFRGAAQKETNSFRSYRKALPKRLYIYSRGLAVSTRVSHPPRACDAGSQSTNQPLARRQEDRLAGREGRKKEATVEHVFSGHATRVQPRGHATNGRK